MTLQQLSYQYQEQARVLHQRIVDLRRAQAQCERRESEEHRRQRIRDLDISRQTLIVIVKRKGRMLIPNGDLTLHQGDRVILYTRTRMAHASSIWL